MSSASLLTAELSQSRRTSFTPRSTVEAHHSTPRPPDILDRAGEKAVSSREGPPKDMDRRLEDTEEAQDAPMEAQKLACDRCRQRKTRCSRGLPCAQCTRVKASCSYEQGQKIKPKRQRVRVSDNLETNISHIMARIDDLTEIVTETRSQVDEILKASQQPTPNIGCPSMNKSPVAVSVPHLGAEESIDPLADSPKTEYEGESSLFGHAQFAATFLQNAIGGNPGSEVRGEMTLVLETLHDIVKSQKQKSDSLGTVFPHARLLPSSSDLRDLSLPPMEKIFGCLRMAQEDRFVLGMWIYEFQNLDQFMHYVIRICSPGPPTELEQVIIFAGLYWLFCECSSLVEDINVKKDYEEQAFLCRDNLETVLLNIRFHVPSSLDMVYAMSMAATYCLQISKISMAWMYICTAVHSAQTLGYHSAVPVQPESDGKKSQTTWLFWAIYSTERLLALRIGRSSTVRDQDITIPPVQPSNNCDTYLRAVFPTWIKTAQIQGSLYDDLYSPGSLSKSEHSRVSRAYELAAEIKKIMDIETEVQRRFIDAWGPNSQRGPNSLNWKIDRVINLSTLTLVYRSIKPNAPGRSISGECLEVARAAMSELSTTLVVFSREAENSIGASLHVNWSLVQAPFVPFITLFCHVIETSEASDLEYLRDCIDSIETMVACVDDAAPKNYLRLFRALYDAAIRYLDARSKSDQTSGQTDLSPWASENPINTTAVAQGSGIVPFTLPQFPQPDSGDYHQTPSSIVAPSTLESQEQLSLGLFGAGVDPQSSNLGSWYYNHHQLMRMLDDM